MEEFLDMLDQGCLFDKQGFTLVQGKECFVASMGFVVDEQRNCRHHEMQFAEFLEAVSCSIHGVLA